MPKANPFAQIAKRLASLQAKSAKVNAEIASLVQIVEVEMKKQDAAPAPVKAAPAKAPVKAAPAKTIAKAVTVANQSVAPKRGRPSKK